MYTVVVTNLKVNRVIYLDTFDKKSDAEYDFNYWISDPLGGLEMNSTPGRFEILGAVLSDARGTPYVSVSLAEGLPSEWVR